MKVLIYGDIGGSGGYIRYCRGLLTQNAIPADLKVLFVCSKSLYNQLKPLDEQVQVIDHPWIDSQSRWKRYLWHLWVYPRIVRTIKPDVEFFAAGQLRVYFRKARTVATCHNLLLFDQKELGRIKDPLEQAYFQDYRKRQVKSFLKSDAVIFLSDYSREVVCKELPAIREYKVISHGLDSLFFQPQKRAYELKETIRMLYVSPIYYYKNHLQVVRAVQALREQTGLNIVLELIGGGNSTAARELKEYIRSEKLDKCIILTEFIQTDELIKAYQSTDIFIFASSCETFGITVLEGMGAGLPIACANRTGLSDILKDAGVYFDPDNTESIVASLKTLLSDTEIRKQFGEKAFEYAQEYTWEHCAKSTFSYIKTIGNQR